MLHTEQMKGFTELVVVYYETWACVCVYVFSKKKKQKAVKGMRRRKEERSERKKE